MHLSLDASALFGMEEAANLLQVTAPALLITDHPVSCQTERFLQRVSTQREKLTEQLFDFIEVVW